MYVLKKFIEQGTYWQSNILATNVPGYMIVVTLRGTTEKDKCASYLYRVCLVAVALTRT